MKDSLRYAEYVLAKTKEEKELIERQLQFNNHDIDEIKDELQKKNNEKDLAVQ